MKYIRQSLVLLLSTLLVAVIVFTSLSSYTPLVLLFLGVASLCYALLRRKRNRGQEMFIGSGKEIFVILTAILLIVFLTGGIRSPIFFLTYFILFGIAFIFEPIMIVLFLLCLGAVFMPQVLQDDIFGNSLKLGSLIFLTPIAFFFGREYRRREKLQEKVKATTESIIEEAEEILQTKDKNERLKKAEEIIEEARQLKKETEE